MVSPTINRVKGKTLEQRRRDKGRMVKANLKQAGKILKSQRTGVRDRGQVKMSKKKAKKAMQKARLLGSTGEGGSSNKMEL